jgi:hypothetical protein
MFGELLATVLAWKIAFLRIAANCNLRYAQDSSVSRLIVSEFHGLKTGTITRPHALPF